MDDEWGKSWSLSMTLASRVRTRVKHIRQQIAYCIAIPGFRKNRFFFILHIVFYHRMWYN